MYLKDTERLNVEFVLRNFEALETINQRAEFLRRAEEEGRYIEEEARRIEAELENELIDVIRSEHRSGATAWHTSRKGKNHIVVKNNKCIFLNIYGAKILFADWLLFEEKMFLRNFDWIEKDNLVIFEIYDAVNRETKKCICHYTNDSYGFTYFTPAESCDENPQDSVSEE